jgi:hypothetical protein
MQEADRARGLSSNATSTALNYDRPDTDSNLGHTEGNDAIVRPD